MTTKPVKAKPIRRSLKAAAPAAPAPQSVSKPRPRIPSPPDLAPVQLSGTYIESVSVVARTLAQLHLSPGRIEEEQASELTKVLLPFAEVRLGGGAIGELATDDNSEIETDTLPTLFTTSLPLENLAFVLLDLTSDLKRMCHEICEMGDGALGVDRARMAHVRYFLAHLERQARLARIRLDDRYGIPETDGA